MTRERLTIPYRDGARVEFDGDRPVFDAALAVVAARLAVRAAITYRRSSSPVT